jgi:hypothetical protein
MPVNPWPRARLDPKGSSREDVRAKLEVVDPRGGVAARELLKERRLPRLLGVHPGEERGHGLPVRERAYEPILPRDDQRKRAFAGDAGRVASPAATPERLECRVDRVGQAGRVREDQRDPRQLQLGLKFSA